VHFLKYYYQNNESLENAFLPKKDEKDTAHALARFRDLFFSAFKGNKNA
jgi:hypothetical protein